MSLTLQGCFQMQDGVSLFSELKDDILLCFTITSKFLLLPLKFFLHRMVSAFAHLHFHLLLITASTALISMCLWYLFDMARRFFSLNMNQLYYLMQNSPLCFPSNLLEALQQRRWHTYECIYVKNMHKVRNQIKVRNKDLSTLLEEAWHMPVTSLLSFLVNVAVL